MQTNIPSSVRGSISGAPRALGTHSLFWIILAVYLLLASAYSIINPLFESPDEIWHYEYVRWLAEGQGLAHPDDVGHAPWHQEGSQPPLYYLAAAALTAPIPTDNADAVIRYNPHAAIGQSDAYGNKNMMAHGPAESWPWRGVALAAHVARFFSVLLGAVTVSCTYATARLFVPARPAAALLAAALVAFNPQFLFLSGSINNDNLVTACSAAAIFFATYLLHRQETTADGTLRPAAPTVWQIAAFGALAGVGALSKLSGLLLCVLVAITLVLLAWQRRESGGHFLGAVLRWGMISAGAALVVAGWWYLRNWLLFGDPLALSAMFAILPQRPAPPTLAELLARAPGVWRSFWAVFGWFNVVAEPWLYAVYTVVSVVGLVGFVLVGPLRRFWAKSDADAPRSPQFGQAILLLLWIALIVLSLLQWAQMRYPQGRLLYPALSALAVVLGVGLMNWVPRRGQRPLAVALATGLLALALLAPVRWIEPAYAAPAPLPLDAPLPDPVNVAFGDQIRLRGATVSATELYPDQVLELDLFWEATEALDRNYSVFIHLTDTNEILQAQRDSYPAAGSLPTSDWPTGVLILDRHRITIPATVPAPNRLRIDVGVYEYGSNERLPAVDGEINGGASGDFWTLGYITLLAPTGDSDLPHSVFINFEDQIALIGFEFDRRVMRPGETLGLTLWWEALAVPASDYKVFTHLILPPEATWAQMDSRPQRGASRTETWQPGDRIEDSYELTLPDTAPPGVYFVEIGIYDADTHDRLTVNFSDKGIVLGQVRVE